MALEARDRQVQPFNKPRQRAATGVGHIFDWGKEWVWPWENTSPARGRYLIKERALMKDRLEIARDWLPRYTGMPLDEFGNYILLTNFQNYVKMFAEKFDCNIYGECRPTQTLTVCPLSTSVSARPTRPP
jgi:hypothetical protein